MKLHQCKTHAQMALDHQNSRLRVLQAKLIEAAKKEISTFNQKKEKAKRDVEKVIKDQDEAKISKNVDIKGLFSNFETEFEGEITSIFEASQPKSNAVSSMLVDEAASPSFSNAPIIINQKDFDPRMEKMLGEISTILLTPVTEAKKEAEKILREFYEPNYYSQSLDQLLNTNLPQNIQGSNCLGLRTKLHEHFDAEFKAKESRAIELSANICLEMKKTGDNLKKFITEYRKDHDSESSFYADLKEKCSAKFSDEDGYLSASKDYHTSKLQGEVLEKFFEVPALKETQNKFIESICSESLASYTDEALIGISSITIDEPCH